MSRANRRLRFSIQGFALRFSSLLLAVWQKVCFWLAKGMVLACKRYGFTMQNVRFRKAKPHVWCFHEFVFSVLGLRSCLRKRVAWPSWGAGWLGAGAANGLSRNGLWNTVCCVVPKIKASVPIMFRPLEAMLWRAMPQGGARPAHRYARSATVNHHEIGYSPCRHNELGEGVVEDYFGGVAAALVYHGDLDVSQ